MNILKTERLFLITPEVNANSSSICIKSLFIHSLSLDVPPACLSINHPRWLCQRYRQLTTVHCEMQSGTSAVYVLSMWSNQQSVLCFRFTNFRFQIIRGSSGATDVTKNLKLSKIYNFFWQGSDAAQKNCCFAQFLLVANKFRLITNVGGLGVRILCYN